jgi:hypothetical protein
MTKDSPSQVLADLMPIDVYYDPYRSGGSYWVKDMGGKWILVTETSLKRILKSQGLNGSTAKGDLMSEVDTFITRIQLEQNVDFAGPLAGYTKGLHEMCSIRALVTEGPRLIEPAPGGWPILGQLIEGMLSDEVVDQRMFFFGWLKIALEALRSGQRRPGQALVLAGEHACGKSLLQNLLTQMLGGRAGKPYQFMTGETGFNADLFGAEHLMIEDEAGSTDLRARRTFGAYLKQICASDTQRMHAKNRTPIMLSPFWRLSVTVNLEPENLQVLPPIDESLQDKLMLLRANKKPMPMETETMEQRRAFWMTLMSELPAFVDFLLKWKITPDIASARYGVMEFHHPQILSAIDDLAPERRLLSLIDLELFDTPGAGPFEGSAEELERKLTAAGAEAAFEARRVLSYNTACGVYLARLAKKVPHRISFRVLHGRRIWKIQAP